MASGTGKAIRKRRSSNSSNRFQNIPKELLTEILARVSQSSIADLFNAKRTCKILNEAASEDYVFEHVSLNNIDEVSWSRKNQAHKEAFVERCVECGNPAALFREGLGHVFGKEDDVELVNLGFRQICRASDMGHLGATYVCGIILVCLDGEKRQAGLELLSRQLMRSSELIKRCRKEVISVLSRRWILNHKIGERDPNNLQPEHNCEIKSRGRSWDDDEFDVLENYDSCCAACQWDHETKLFFKMLKRGGFNS